MLPNHSPLVIAEQFGTLAALHPGRIDLGLGRAPGHATSPRCERCAATRSPPSTFPQDVLELQAFLRDESRIPGVRRDAGQGHDVPLYILGSSLFGAQLAALLGLPYGFASHFAPDGARGGGGHVPAASSGRRRSSSAPYVIAGVNVITADTDAEAQEQLQIARTASVRAALQPRGEPRCPTTTPTPSCARRRSVPGRPDDAVHRRRHPRRRARVPRRVRCSAPTPTS